MALINLLFLGMSIASVSAILPSSSPATSKIALRVAASAVEPIDTVPPSRLPRPKSSQKNYARNLVASVLLSGIMVNTVVSNGPEVVALKTLPQAARVAQREQAVAEALRQRDAAKAAARPLSLPLLSSLSSIELPFELPEAEPSTLPFIDVVKGTLLGAIPFLALPGILLLKVQAAFRRAQVRMNF